MSVEVLRLAIERISEGFQIPHVRFALSVLISGNGCFGRVKAIRKLLLRELGPITPLLQIKLTPASRSMSNARNHRIQFYFER